MTHFASKQLWPVALVAITILVQGCASTQKTVATAPSPNVLRVGVSPTSPPMVFEQNGAVVGVEADLALALGKELGRQVVFVQEDWEKLVDALCDNRVDIIMSSMTITPTRAYRVAFSNPYLRVGQMVLARSGEKYNYMLNIAKQAENGVAVKPGTTADFLVRQEFPNLKRKYYRSGDEAAAALVKKKVDLFVSDAPMIWHLAAVYEPKGVTVLPMVLKQEELGWAVRRGDSELLAAVNSFLNKAQESGQAQQVFRKWMPGFK